MGFFVSAAGSAESGTWAEILSSKISPRQPFAISGSKFCAYVAQMDEARREIAIENQFLQGNIPSFLRRLKPVRAQYKNSDGSRTTALFFVTPDYLAIGSDDDFVRIPMNRNTATRVAARFGFVLPTPKMVDAIYDQSDFRFTPQPMPPGARILTCCKIRNSPVSCAERGK